MWVGISNKAVAYGKYVPAEWVRKEGGRRHTAQHSTAHYTTEGTAESGTQGTHAGGVGQAQEDTTRPKEGEEQAEDATGHRPNATTN